MISRKRASLRNATVAFISQLIIMAGQFAVQTIFIRTLGAKYLGANGLFANLMTFLSFAELGIGSAFSYALYKPLAESDHVAIRAIMQLFKKVYNTIGIVILVGGLILSAFIPWFINGNSNINHIRLYFIVYLLGTVVTYFFTYNRSLIIADQMSYIDALNRLLFTILRYGSQIYCLLVWQSYFGYLAMIVLTNLFANIAITYQSHRRYPYLLEKESNQVDPQVVSEIKRNVVGTISSKIGAIVVTGTDNILISKYLGLTIVGIYSNYALVLNSITTLLGQVFSAVIASFGNLGVTESNNKSKQVSLFNQFVYANAIVVFFIGLVSYGFFPPFIRLWLGDSYQLEQSTLIVIVINFVLSQFRPALNMINAYGLFWGYRVKSIVEAVVNLGLSLILVRYTSLGINGVLIGTIIGNILVNSWWDPLILFHGAYKVSMLKYYISYWTYLGVFGILLAVEIVILNYINLSVHGIGQLLIFGFTVSLIVMVILLTIFAFTKSQRIVLRGLHSVLKKLKH